VARSKSTPPPKAQGKRRQPITYDPAVDALAIIVGKGGPVAQTRELAHGILADFDARGVMLSLEILDARQRVGEQLLAQLT